MGKTSINLQDGFLNQIRRDGVEVKIDLMDGSSMVGTVRGFDNFTIILGCDDAQHLIYKHAVSQVVLDRHDDQGGSRDNREAGQGRREH